MVLFEAWVNCGGNWATSQLFLQSKSTNREKAKGVRKWLTEAELVQRFGQDNAEALIMRKLQDPVHLEREVRRHPDLPDSVEMMQFLVLDMEQVSTEREDVIEMLYRLAEKKDSESSGSTHSSEEKPKKKEGNQEAKEQEGGCSTLYSQVCC